MRTRFRRRTGAAVLAAAGQCKTVRAVATINAPFDVAHAIHQFAPEDLAAIERDGSAEVHLAQRPFRVGKELIDSLRTQDQGKRIASLRRPLLLLHAPTDNMVSIDHATRIYAAARQPKSFLSLDKADHLLSRRDWFDPDGMASMQPFSLKARDGLPLQGYVTVPKGAANKNLPMI